MVIPVDDSPSSSSNKKSSSGSDVLVVELSVGSSSRSRRDGVLFPEKGKASCGGSTAVGWVAMRTVPGVGERGGFVVVGGGGVVDLCACCAFHIGKNRVGLGAGGGVEACVEGAWAGEACVEGACVEGALVVGAGEAGAERTRVFCWFQEFPY